jgi:hypothetical protein
MAGLAKSHAHFAPKLPVFSCNFSGVKTIGFHDCFSLNFQRFFTKALATCKSP